MRRQRRERRAESMTNGARRTFYGISHVTRMVFAAWLPVAFTLIAWLQTPAPPASTLDFETFRTEVQPILLARHPGFARCYVCHSQGTPFRLQPLSQGARMWNDEESRKNFDAVRRLVVPGDPTRSRLLLMPLAAEAGGVAFHPGGKRWTTTGDPEWRTIAAWIRAARMP